MTTEKMPDVIWAYRGYSNNMWSRSNKDHHHNLFNPRRNKVRYLRAEPVEAREKAVNELLETARHFMSRVARGDYDTGTLLPLILMIDKFLGGKE